MIYVTTCMKTTPQFALDHCIHLISFVSIESRSIAWSIDILMMAVIMAHPGTCNLASSQQLKSDLPGLWKVCNRIAVRRAMTVVSAIDRFENIYELSRSPTRKLMVPLKKLAILFCDHLENRVMSLAEKEREECRHLAENYAPVSEMAPTANLPVVGSIPECMNGEFLRVGPNPKFEPVAGYHWFDGDGMIHALKIKNGKATYAARYVQTYRLQQEELYGASKFPKMGDMTGFIAYFVVALSVLRSMLGVLDCSNGIGTGNTALVFHNKKLLALHERDRPYSMKVLEDGDLETVGIEDFGQKLNHPFTAHPKIDPKTGEMFIFTYQLQAPKLIYRVISKDGIVGEPVPIKISGAVIMHDFAITQNHVIFMDLPLFLDVWGMATGNFVMKYDSSKEHRLGIFPRYATDGSQIRWFKIPPCFIFHTVNAWEEGDEVIFLACVQGSIDLAPVQGFKRKKLWSLGSRLSEFRMNLKTGEVEQRLLSIWRPEYYAEFPRINEEYTGRKVRYAYCAVFDEQDKSIGLAKFDLSMEPAGSLLSRELIAGGNIAGVFHYGPGRVGGDPIFVPRKPAAADVAEDDGYLISFVHDVNTNNSEVVIIDAKTMALDPVAVVRLPRRVPYGFHACFLSEEQLKQQAALKC